MIARNDATLRQIEAAAPIHSTWLSANAGSGKTRVLTDRVARLLLMGVDPQNVLCLTYTKAAASEMQNRLFQRLGNWAMMGSDGLRDQLDELGVEGPISDQQMQAARRLFARAIETPGGLKIQTIHSFCAGILRRFPLEAGVSPQFTEMEERAAELLRADITDQVAEESPETFAEFARYFTGDDITKFTQGLVSRKRELLAEGSLKNVQDLLGARADATSGQIIKSEIDHDCVTLIKRVVEICRTGGKNDNKAADHLQAIQNIDGNAFDLMCQVFLTGKSAKSPFSAKLGMVPTKAVSKANPDIVDELNDLMTLVQDLRPIILSQRAYDRTAVLYRFAQAFLPAYERAKLLRGMLDFDDLISKARSLLTDPMVADWVLFRLDGGIDHILVDEAQDTSPEQWAVVKLLSREFAAGEGARPDRRRTIFVVGDKKQSIYSFQGADPREFDRMKQHFGSELSKVNDTLYELPLEHSFRSSPAILSLVDQVFTGELSQGLEKEVHHVAFKSDMPGRVDLWPPVEPSDQKADPDAKWFDPVDRKGARHHNVLLAEQVAKSIQALIQGETLPVEVGRTGTFERRPITEGDILVLVQQRDMLFEEIIRACKALSLNIAGADRLRIGGELAVKDLSALLNFLALPEDDLSLAAALRSPLFGWTEQDLFSVAHDRPKHTYLWQSLRESKTHPETLEMLNDLRAQADFLRPYDLIERILIRHDGRQRLLGRLGTEAEDGIDALLSQALAYEQADTPSLTGFLSWLETEDIEIKRQMDSQGDRIRVMTVHGAKGLEAPIVILPDTRKRSNQIRSDLLKHGDTVFWKPKSDQVPQAIADIMDEMLQRQIEEKRRLLYVALTRAESWLIVCAAGDVGDESQSWYRMIEQGLQTSGAVEHTHPTGEGLRLSHMDWAAGELRQYAPEMVTAVPAPDLAVLKMPTHVEGSLSPSKLGGAKAVAGEVSDRSEEESLEYGNLVHYLLEHLANSTPSDRQKQAQQMLDMADSEFEHDQSSIIQACLGVLSNDALSHLFQSNSCAEVPITANIPELGGRRINGIIDRLVVTNDEVLIVDFKSNRIIPDRAETVPLGIVRQLATYQSAVSQLYPDMRVKCFILWTQSSELTLLEDKQLHDSLASVSVP